MLALLYLLMTQPYDFVAPGATVVKLPGTYKFTEGPTWTKHNTLIFSDIPANTIFEYNGKEVTKWREDTNGANGNTIDREGNVYSCEHTSRSVTKTVNGVTTPIASVFGGKRLNSQNDIAIHPSGLILFTDPTYGIRPAQMEQEYKFVYQIEPKTNRMEQVYKGRNQPNGLVFSPDGKTLYVADSGDGGIDVFDYEPNKILTPKFKFDSPGPDGIRVDREGRIWAACGDGVNVYSPDGNRLQNIKFPEQPANLCFGGADGKTLYVTARTGVYSLQLHVAGVMPGFEN